MFRSVKSLRRFGIRSVRAIAILGVSVFVAVGQSSQQQVITFQDLGQSDLYGSSIPPVYAGMAWTNFCVLTVPNYPNNPSGYQAATISGQNVAYNCPGVSPQDQAPASFSAKSGTFTLNSASLTAAWRDNLIVAIQGLYKGQTVDQTVVVLNPYGPAYVTFNWSGLDTVVFTPSGGTPVNRFPFALENFAIANLAITPTTEVAITPHIAFQAATAGTSFSYTFTATGGTGPYSFLASGLPAGWTLTTSGATATVAGTLSLPSKIPFPIPNTGPGFPFVPPLDITVTVNDATGNSDSGTITINVLDCSSFCDTAPPLDSNQKDQYFKTANAEAAYVLALIAVAAQPACAAIVVCELVVDAQITGVSELATLNYAKAADPPDPNFQVVYQPTFGSITLPTSYGTSDPVLTGVLNQFIQNLNEQIGLNQAIIVSLNRYGGARQAHDNQWAAVQLQAAKWYSLQLATKTNDEASIRSGLAAQLVGVIPSVEISADQVSVMQSQVMSTGWNTSQQAFLTSWGLNSSEMILLGALIAGPMRSSSVVFPGAIADPGLLLVNSQAGGASATFGVDRNNDSRVDCGDIAVVRAAFGTRVGQPGYDPMADVNADGVVDALDVFLVSQHLAAGTVCDTTPPVITPIVSGVLGNNGWYRSAATVTWSVTDPESGIASSTGCSQTALTADTAGVTVTCNATNGGGLSASVPVTVKIDQTPPISTATPVPGPNAHGWNNTGVTVSFTGTDNLSGIESCSGQLTFTNEGGGQSASGTCTDKAGNVSSPAAAKVNIDKTPPHISGMPAAGCSLWPPNGKLVQVAVVIAADALSGLVPGSFSVMGTSNEPSSDPKNPEIVVTPDGSGGLVVQLQADRFGTGNGRVYTLTATANDLAGNTATTTATCTVPHDQGQ
jgi:Dockerin type I domain